MCGRYGVALGMRWGKGWDEGQKEEKANAVLDFAFFVL